MSGRPPWAATSAGIRIRHAESADHAALATFLRAMDGEGLYQRHFTHGEAPNLALLGRLAAVDGRHRVMLLAVDADSTLVGHAEYVADGHGAEFALMVLPNRRDGGIGQALLDGLIAAATGAGLQHLHGLIQASNTRAIQLVRKRGFRVARGDDARTVIVSRPLSPLGATGIEPAYVAHPIALSPDRHDPHRVPLYRCPGP